MILRKKKLIIAIIALAILAPSLWWWNQTRKESIADAINPMYWIRRWRGEDLFDYNKYILYHGNRSLKEVAITIDDGPHVPMEPQLLSIFEKNHIHATFFLVGIKMKIHPNIIRRMVQDGDELANHTMDHYRLSYLSPWDIHNEILNNDINLYRITGLRFHLLRPPGMNYNDKVLKVEKNMGYVTVSWDCAAEDYENKSPDFIYDRIMRRVENGSIILLHDDMENTVIAMPRIISALKEQGYQFVTISQMLEHLPHPVYADRLKSVPLPAYVLNESPTGGSLTNVPSKAIASKTKVTKDQTIRIK
jgi:peptidoglycan/xylan/chitin deacetylase (PgdA/CDA1 family)